VNFKQRPTLRSIGDGNPPAVALDDIAHEIKPQPRSMRRLRQPVERPEDFLAMFGIDPRTIVRNTHPPIGADLNPDIHLGPLVNFQRIKTNFFYDYGQGEGKSFFYDARKPSDVRIYYSDNAAVYKSAGFEMTFDVNLIRVLPQFELGFRTTYLFANPYTQSGVVFEFLLGNIPF
jgi:hypothetical protein